MLRFRSLSSAAARVCGSSVVKIWHQHCHDVWGQYSISLPEAKCSQPADVLRGGELQAEPVRAHAVVVTLPLGVLKCGCVAFSPPLPECGSLHTSSISKLLYGALASASSYAAVRLKYKLLTKASAPSTIGIYNCCRAASRCTIRITVSIAVYPAGLRPRRSTVSRWARRTGSRCCPLGRSLSGRRTPTSCAPVRVSTGLEFSLTQS